MHLRAPITVTELRNAVAGMRSNTAPGPFGIDIGCLTYLLRVDFLAQLVAQGLQRLLEEPPTPALCATFLTAIPKPDRTTEVAANLHPILVTATWYRLLMRIFIARLSPALPVVMSSSQHGFCPGRSTSTALASILPVLEFTGTMGAGAVCALDIHKAYDSVNRAAMDVIAGHLGLTDNGFWRLMQVARDAGPVYITGHSTLAEPFTTSRGIK